MIQTFQKTIIKATITDAERQRMDYQRQHELALLNLLIPRHLEKAQEILSKHKNNSCKDENKVVNYR